MNINRASLFQVFKYAVYCLLALNIFFFGREEYLAALLQFPGGVPPGQLIEAYASTIDTAAWVVLLLMFELETYLLEDRHFTPAVKRTLHGVRIFCYTFIVYAFYGYVVNVFFVYDTALLGGITDLCAVSADGWSYAIDLDEYVAITAANCTSFSDATAYWHLTRLPALVDYPGLIDIQRLAWTDVINAGVWILIVIILEVDVRLQEKGRFDGLALRLSTAFKVVSYSILFLAAVYWGIKGDFVDFWDAFLWLLAFFFIELNVVEWRHEDLEAGKTA
ncbi:MAG: hypothetical protein R3288_04375 [Woeseiaceae bacterium]|nr:hypothetical protein [Woeseiaceae bacterium]